MMIVTRTMRPWLLAFCSTVAFLGCGASVEQARTEDRRGMVFVGVKFRELPEEDMRECGLGFLFSAPPNTEAEVE